MSFKNSASAVTIAYCLFSAQAAAQYAQEQETGTVDVITVTAQHRSENAQDVPISLSAMTGDMLAESNTDSLQDLSATVPSLVVSTSVSYGLAPIAIRGIGGPAGGGSLLTDQPVAVYADGVYVRALGQSVSDFLDVESVQVLRGPQGTLYGRNSTAGAILLTSRRPTDEFGGNLQLRYASHDEASLAGAVNIPLVEDRLAMRLAARHTSGGDWADNTLDDREFGGGESTSGRMSLRYTPSADLTIDLIGDIARAEARPAVLQLTTIELGNPIPVLPLQLYRGAPHVRRSDFAAVRDSNELQIIGEQFTETESQSITLSVEWDLNDALTLTSITGARHFNVQGMQDTTPWINGPLPGSSGAAFWNNLTGTPPLDGQGDSLQFNTAAGAFTLGWNTTDQTYDSWSQEVRLSSNTENFRWTLGLYYAQEDVDGYIRIVNEQGGPPMLVVPVPGVVPGSASGLDLGFSTTQTATVYALFADATYDLSERWALTGGLRYSRDEKETTIVNTTQTLRTSVVPPLNAGVVSECPGGTNDCEAAFERLTPRLVLSYTPNDDTLIYASYSEGFTSGGFNNFGDISGTLPDRPLDIASETIANYEIGVKSEFFSNRLRMNVGAFRTNYEDLQIRQAVNTGGVAIVNVPAARIHGVELESVFEASDALQLSFNLSWLDAEIREGELFAFPDDIGTVTFGTTQTPVAIDVSGNHMTRAPEWIGNLAAYYTQTSPFGLVRGSAAYRFQSESHFSETNQDIEQFVSEGWSEVDLRVALESFEGGWELAVFARNVFNERHATQIVPFFMMPTATLNAPRTLGGSLTLRF